LTAHKNTEIWDAVEVGWTGHSNMSMTTVSNMTLNIHTLEEIKPVLEMVVNSEFLDTLMSQLTIVIHLLKQLLNNQSLLLSMLLSSNSIHLVFWTNVMLTSITVLLLLDSLQMPGSSETLGDKDGENKDISDLQEETLVVFVKLLHSQLFDIIK